MESIRIAECLLLLLAAGYACMVVWFSLPLLLRKSHSPSAPGTPFVTVIIAARNEERNITACLESLLQQDYPKEQYEVVVSDDHSTDGTKEVVSAFRERHPMLKLSLLSALSEDRLGKKAAIERAIRTAKGEWILTTDADTLRSKGWLKAMTGELTGSGTRMVLGPVLLDGSSLFQRIQSLEFLGIMGLTAGSAMSGTPVMCNGANLLYGKRAFDVAGGFSGNDNFPSGDDQFLMSSFKRKYCKGAIVFALNREAVVVTEAERTLGRFFSQRLRWVSKSKGYRDPVVVATGMITWIFQAALFTYLVAAAWVPSLLPVVALGFGLKLVTDLFPVMPMALFFGKRKDLWLYLPAQVFQAFYVPVTGIAGLILPYRWKGRLIKA